jgi:DNA-binding transcriptional MocR family regulator
MDSIPTLTDREGPFHFRIVAALAADIESGGPLRGQELSMHRELAKTLGIDLTTMTRAYTEARHPGLTQARSGQGTFVVESLSCPTRCVGQRLGFDLSMIFPSQPPGLRPGKAHARAYGNPARGWAVRASHLPGCW